MTLFNRMSSLWNSPKRQAEQAFVYANKWAIFTRDGYRSQFSFLSKVHGRNWDFVITVICLYVLLMDTKGEFRDEATESAIRKDFLQFIKLSKIEGIVGSMHNCLKFMESDPKNLKSLSPNSRSQYLETSLGYWALKTMLDRDLEGTEELGAARAVGAFFTNAMHGFWRGQHIPFS